MPDTQPSPFKTGAAGSHDESHNLARGLLRIHQVITRGVEVACRQSRAYAGGEPVGPALAAGFADYLQALVSVLHGHHTGEDEVAFPALRGRFPEVPWDLLSEEHRTVVPILADINGRAASIRQQPSPDSWTTVASLLERLAALWETHRRREETHLTVSKVDALVPADEQAALVARLSAHSQEHSGPAHLVVPFVLYNLAGSDRRAMGALFPPVVTEQLVPVVWQEKWSPMKPFLLGSD